MKQIITLNFGQPGINIGDETLSLYLKEHGINSQDQPPSSISLTPPLIDQKYNPVFFEQSQGGNIMYRSISVDCDPYSSDYLLSGRNRIHYKRDRMISAKDSTGGAYSRGYTLAERQLCERAENELQKVLENCDNLQGIIINASLLGGSSGVFHNVMKKLMGEEYLRKKTAVTNVIFPSKSYANSIVEIYNYTLSFRTLLEFSHLNIPYDNQSLYRRAQEAGIDNPGYKQINRFIANMQSSITLPMRSISAINSQLQDLTTNLVAYPRINLVYPSCSLRTTNQMKSVDELTRNIFSPKSRLVQMHSVENKIAVGLYFRGDITPFEVHSAIKRFRDSRDANCKFTDWSPLGFKVGLNNEPLYSNYGQYFSQSRINNRSCCSLTSSMEFNKLLGHNSYKFDRLFCKRAYVYTFIQDMMEQGEFVETRQDLAALQKDYQSWQGFTQQQEEE